MGEIYMSATEAIKGILADKNVTQVELADFNMKITDRRHRHKISPKTLLSGKLT